MPETYAQALRRAERENEKNRGIKIISRRYTISDLMRDYHPTQNLLVDGADDNRKTALYRWIERLYVSEDAFRYPIIVISSARETIADYFYQQLKQENIPFTRNFVRINAARNKSAGYEFGLGLPVTDIHEVLTSFAERKRMNITLWTIFDAVWEMLTENGYETNLENIQKVYHLGREGLSHLLSCAGKRAAAQNCRSSAEEYEQMRSVLDRFLETFAALSGNDQKRSSAAAQIPAQMKWRPLPGLPLIYFELPDRMMADFLDYFQVELRFISSETKPLVIIDSVALSQNPTEVTPFYRYISMHPNICLTLTAANCLSLLPQNDPKTAMASLDGAYRFRMILVQSTNDAAALTGHRVGSYQHLTINENRTTHRETFHLFRDGVNAGWSETRESRERIRLDDVHELDQNDCYELTETGWFKYTHMIFR